MARDDERIVFVVSTFDEPVDAPGPLNLTVRHRVMSVDLCGQEPPVTIVEDANMVVAPREPGHPWLACALSAETSMYIVDPAGERIPSLVGTTRGCNPYWAQGSMWVQRRDTPGSTVHSLVRIGGADDIEVVQEGVTSNTELDDQRLWFVDVERRLIETSIGAQSTTVLVEDAGIFAMTDEHRFIAWGREDWYHVPGEWTILDRESGDQTPVEIDGEREIMLRLADFSFVFEQVDDSMGPEPVVQTLHVRVPSLERVVFPGKWKSFHDAGPGELLMLSDETDRAALYVLRAGASSPELLYDGHVPAIRVDDGEVWAWEYYERNELETGYDSKARLVRIPIDGGEPTIVVDEVFHPVGLEDGRWLTVRDYAPAGLGQLRLLDPDAGTEQTLADDVTVFFQHFNGAVVPSATDGYVGVDEPVLYTVHGTGDRDGLWSVRIPPR